MPCSSSRTSSPRRGVTDDEELGAITRPARRVNRERRWSPRRYLERHPMKDDDTLEPCARCGRLGLGYAHPDLLRPGVVLWRCYQHRFPSTVVDDPKAAPGGGVYR